MNIPRIQIVALGTALLAAAGNCTAQIDPGQSQPTQQQSNQQQQQPGASRNALGSDMQDSAPSSGISGQMMKDKIFLRKAAEGGLAEVQFGQLASRKASAQEVKDFGSKMVTDHTDLNNDMKPIADSLGVMLPKKLSGKDQAEYDKLNGLSGEAFDTEYLTFMVKDHHTDLHDFRVEAASAADPALKAAAEKGAKVIREHTSMVDGLARSKGIAVPARSTRPAAPGGE